MHDLALLIPILVSLGFFAMVFGIVYMFKRENLAMIEKGMNPKQFANRPMPYTNLKYGLLLVGAGIGLFLAYMLDQYMVPNKDNEAIYFALIAIGGGLGLIGSYRIEKKELLDKNKGSE
jgi:amino acid transporter